MTLLRLSGARGSGLPLRTCRSLLWRGCQHSCSGRCETITVRLSPLQGRNVALFSEFVCQVTDIQKSSVPKDRLVQRPGCDGPCGQRNGNPESSSQATRRFAKTTFNSTKLRHLSLKKVTDIPTTDSRIIRPLTGILFYCKAMAWAC